MGLRPIIVVLNRTTCGYYRTTKNPIPGLRIDQNSGSGTTGRPNLPGRTASLAGDYTANPCLPAMPAAARNGASQRQNQTGQRGISRDADAAGDTLPLSPETAIHPQSVAGRFQLIQPLLSVCFEYQMKNAPTTTWLDQPIHAAVGKSARLHQLPRNSNEHVHRFFRSLHPLFNCQYAVIQQPAATG
ncbi:MAG: hypothetical protein BMS9Abin32_096 [Gammaproteobacteria bacterium]|nr:MAG: hypothetical protein BMS9Abin32_096 [Gammaproteobacteria bacterium]